MCKLGFKVLSTAFVIGYVGSATALSYEDVLGKVFINSGGSCCGTFLMSASVKATGRNTVEMGFFVGGLAWSDVNISAIADHGQAQETAFVMLNCKYKTYSIQAEAKDGYSQKEYLAGSKYKWGDYSSGELMNVSKDYQVPLTKFFKTVCDYTSQ